MTSLLEKFQTGRSLRALSRERDDASREQRRHDLFVTQLTPVIERTIRQKLKAGPPYEPESVAERAWDIASTQTLALLEEIETGKKESPDSLPDYVATLAHHAVGKALADSDPIYRAFRLQALDTMKRYEKQIALWSEVRRRWCAEQASRTAQRRSGRWDRLQNNPLSVWQVQTHGHDAPLIRVLHALLLWLAHPVPVESFVRVLAEATGERMAKTVSLSGTVGSDGEEAREVEIAGGETASARAERKALIDGLLDAIGTVDRRRRIVLLLQQLPLLCEIETSQPEIRGRVRDLLDIGPNFDRLWERGECSDQEIATLLETTANNVGVLRNNGRGKLATNFASVWE